MNIGNNISLKSYNTFGIDAYAEHFVSVTSLDELTTVLDSTDFTQKFVLGGGSNLLLTKDIEGIVIHIGLKGKTLISDANDVIKVKIGAGENWHHFVMWCLENDYGGVENLALIPGNVGTAPIQNIGAYGVELKDVFDSCEALHIKSQEIKTFTNNDCQFGYRNSIFKQEAKDEYILLNVTFRLTKVNHIVRTQYGTIKSELLKNGISIPTIQDVAKAVIQIRSSKLPDPKEIGNSGSFFKNPIIVIDHFKKLQENFADIPSYPVSKKLVKVPAAWLIEKSGFKGKRLNNYGVHNKQALVLVNYGGASGTDILKLSETIQNTVKKLFNINLETEVNII